MAGEYAKNLTFAFSLISSITTLIALVALAYLAREQKYNAREKLVACLILAGFINSTNNAIANGYVNLGHNEPLTGTACSVNGWIGQVFISSYF